MTMSRTSGLFLLASALAFAAAPGRGLHWQTDLAVPSQTGGTSAIQVQFAYGGNVAQVPLELTGNLIFVPVRINGLQPSNFILDSGSNNTVLDAARAGELGLLPSGSGNAHDRNDQVEPSFLQGVELELPGIRVREPRIVVFPLGNISSFTGRAVQGILGMDFLSRFVVEVNYSRQTVQLYDPATYRYKGRGSKLPLRLVDASPHVRAKFQVPGHRAVEGDFEIDTGDSSAILLSQSFLNSNRIAFSGLPTVSSFASGVGGEQKALVVRLESLELGQSRLAQPAAEIVGTPPALGLSKGGLIGEEVLRRFTVIFDFPHERLILEPDKLFPEPFIEDMSGLKILAKGPELHTFEVQHVLEHSPAAEAGLKQGDVILAVDNDPATDYTLDDIRDLFKQEGRACRLTVQRGAQKFQLELKLRRLI